MAATLRDGPALRVVGTCEGCLHVRHSSKHWMRGQKTTVYCAASALTRKVGGARTPTPSWCPRLPEARAALGRELVAETTPRRRHVVIISATHEIGAMGCMSGATDADIEHARRGEMDGTRFEEINPEKCPICKEAERWTCPHGAGEESEDR